MDVALPRSTRLANVEQYSALTKVGAPSSDLLVRRAHYALELDHFAAARADIEAIDPGRRTALAWLLLARSCRQSGDIQSAKAAAITARECEPNGDLARSICIELASIQKKAGEAEAAKSLLSKVLQREPACSPALRRLVAILFGQGDFSEAMRLLDVLEPEAGLSTRFLVSRCIALAGMGEKEKAAALLGLQEFLADQDLPQMEDLNARAVEEMRNHPARRFGNSAQASEGSWRIDELCVREQPAIERLLEIIAKRVSDYAGSLPQVDHPWLAARPAKARLNAWAIIAPAGGVETWHTHDQGWLSGVYYLAIPQGLSGQEGSIEFGWPDKFLSDEQRADLPGRKINPREGDLLLFPSHVHHRTWPHQSEQDRICIAFDVIPAD